MIKEDSKSGGAWASRGAGPRGFAGSRGAEAPCGLAQGKGRSGEARVRRVRSARALCPEQLAGSVLGTSSEPAGGQAAGASGSLSELGSRESVIRRGTWYFLKDSSTCPCESKP